MNYLTPRICDLQNKQRRPRSLNAASVSPGCGPHCSFQPPVTGFGYCLSFLPTVTILSQYFDKRRSVVTAVASTGECFAVFAFAPGRWTMGVSVLMWNGGSDSAILATLSFANSWLTMTLPVCTVKAICCLFSSTFLGSVLPNPTLGIHMLSC